MKYRELAILGLSGVLTSLKAVNAGVHVRPFIAGLVMNMSTLTGKKAFKQEEDSQEMTQSPLSLCSTSVHVPYIKVKKFE